MSQDSTGQSGQTLNTVLTLCAAVLVGLIVVRLGLPTSGDAGGGGGNGGAAYAEMVSHSGDFAILTTAAQNYEILVVLDNRSEELAVYHVLNQQSLELFQRLSLPRVFADARARQRGP